MENSTINYYNENASSFTSHTVDVDFTDTQEKFLGYLQKGAYILDFGCGSGRDTRYFLDKGYRVDAIDGSKELCRLASEYAGIEVRNMLFQELDCRDKYDGIWACSSILHLGKSDLKDVFIKMIAALKGDGILYTSFKYGDFEGVRNGRYFIDFTESSLAEFMKDMKELEVLEYWITSDVRPGRGDEKWINVIARKR